MRLFFAKILIGLLSLLGYQQLGSFTTLNSTDTVKNFPTTYNANLTKTIEIGTTTVASITTLANLSTVGTITSGTWNGSTLTVPYGGTGSTTLSLSQVLLGNGTGNISVVNGFGTSGQFLTSNGAATAPTWQTSSISQNINYQWTGNHTFSQSLTETASTTLTNATTTAFAVTGSVLGLNGLNYRVPSVQGATTTALLNDGSGNLNWDGLDWQALAAQTLSVASTSVNFLNVPYASFYHISIWTAGMGGGNGAVNIRFNGDSTSGNYGYKNWVDNVIVNNISSDSAITISESTTSPVFLDVSITNFSAQIKNVHVAGFGSSGTTAAPKAYLADGIWNNTTNKVTQITIFTSAGITFAANTVIKIYGSSN